jgi:hypothetical protein
VHTCQIALLLIALNESKEPSSTTQISENIALNSKDKYSNFWNIQGFT